MQQTPDFGRRIPFAAAARVSHELYFASRIDPGRALSFPCNRFGKIQLDGLGERVRTNYFFARATVGRYYRPPIVITRKRLTH